MGRVISLEEWRQAVQNEEATAMRHTPPQLYAYQVTVTARRRGDLPDLVANQICRGSSVFEVVTKASAHWEPMFIFGLKEELVDITMIEAVTITAILIP